MEFSSRDDLANYLSHEAHDELRKVFWELCQATMIADVEMWDPTSQEAYKLV